MKEPGLDNRHRDKARPKGGEIQQKRSDALNKNLPRPIGGIRKYRKRARLTQEKLAERIDINPVYMGQIERGYKVPTIDVLLRLARALKVRLRDIVKEL
jgi:DNA-binding XRE family transcriptional regulator